MALSPLPIHPSIPTSWHPFKAFPPFCLCYLDSVLRRSKIAHPSHIRPSIQAKEPRFSSLWCVFSVTLDKTRETQRESSVRWKSVRFILGPNLWAVSENTHHRVTFLAGIPGSAVIKSLAHAIHSPKSVLN